MMKALDKLVQDSYAGCISDLKDIEEIFDRMGKMTWGDMVDLVDAKTGENGLLVIAAALEVGYDESMPDKQIRELGLPEALCLVNKENYISWKNPDLQKEEREVYKDFEEDEERYYADFEEDKEYEKTPRYHQSEKESLEGKYCTTMVLLLHMLTEVQKTSNLFRMFFGISIDALFQYWEKLDLEDFPEEDRSETVIINLDKIIFHSTAEKLGVSIDSRTTIGDIFKEADNIRRTAWRPSEPIEEYRDRILDAYELYKTPLFGSFRKVFPERSEPQQIIGDGSYKEIG